MNSHIHKDNTRDSVHRLIKYTIILRLVFLFRGDTNGDEDARQQAILPVHRKSYIQVVVRFFVP